MTKAILTVWVLIGHASGLPSAFKSLQFTDLASCEAVKKSALRQSGIGANLECVKVNING
jgi:hypothetical protein